VHVQFAPAACTCFPCAHLTAGVQRRRAGNGTPPLLLYIGQHRTIPALRLKHRFGICGTASALPKCSIIHKVLSALLAWHLPHLARRIGT